jgi:hypothetical protein
MNWIKWKLREIKNWLRNFILYRAKWKKLFNSESKMSHWEIINDNENKKITLLYVPNDDYSEYDIRINVSHEEFEDLVKFLIRIR